MLYFVRIISLFFIAFLGAEEPAAEVKEVSKKKEIPLGPQDDYDRGVPRSSLAGFLEAKKEKDYKRAANYLDLHNLPYSMRSLDEETIARQLSIVIERGLWIDLDQINATPKGELDDGLPFVQDRMGQVELEGRKVDILLQRVTREDGNKIWKFSSDTVSQTPVLHAEYGYGVIGEWLIRYLPDVSFMGFHLWQWMTMVGLLIGAYLAAFIPTAIASWFVSHQNTEFRKKITDYIKGPIRIFIALLIAYSLSDLIKPSAQAKAYMQAKTLIIILGIWIVLSLINLVREYLEIRLRENGSELAVVLLRPITNIIKVLVVLIALIVTHKSQNRSTPSNISCSLL